MFDDAPKPPPVSWETDTAIFEISGVCTAKFMVVKGPAVEIQVIPGFSGTGVDDHSGLAAEQPLEIETIPSLAVNPGGDCETEMRTWLTRVPDPRSISILSTDVAGLEKVRLNLYEYQPASEAPGKEGGVRFTLEHTQPPNSRFLIERYPATFPNNASQNPSTDKRVEIEGINTGLYPAIEVEDEAAATLVLVYDYTEAGGIFSWVTQTIEVGTQSAGKRSVSVSTGGNTQNYFGCFPARWNQFSGFTLYFQLKERVTLECDSSAPAL